jgi:hypothetical protein
MVVGTSATGHVTSCNREPSKPGVVHDHIRLRQHQIAAIAWIGVHIPPARAVRGRDRGRRDCGRLVEQH